MSTKLQKEKNKRETRQVRIERSNHILIKHWAIEEGKTMSKFIDEIIKDYFNKIHEKKESANKT